MGCNGSAPGGVAVPIDRLPVAAVRPCLGPVDYIGRDALARAQLEVAVGRMGDELMRCGAEKAAVVAWATGLQSDLMGAAP